MKTGRFLLAVIFLTAIAVQSSLAQGVFQEWSVTKSGTGVLQIVGQRDAGIYRATINLRRGGVAEIQVFGARTYTFTGQWSGNRFSGVDLEITNANGRPGDNGRGRMTFRRNGDLEKFNISGSGIRATYSVTFDATPGGGNNPSQEFVGVYRSVVQVREGREDYTLVRILRIKEDKSVELVSRFKGTEPQVNRNSIRRHGDLLQEIRDRTTIIHTGTWNVVGRRLEINLTTLNGGKEESRLTFEPSGGNLTTILWDKQTYGSEGFKFVRDESADDDDTNQPPTQPPPVGDRLVGRYTVSLQPPDTSGLIERTLELQSGGRATLTQSWSGVNRPRFSNRDVMELGQSILAFGQRNGPIVYSGTWQDGGNNFLTFNFERTFGSRTAGAIIFEIRRDGLVTSQYDENQFGSKQFLLSRTGGRFPGNPNNPNPNDQDPTPRQLAGNYSTTLRVPDTTGDIERRLELDGNGSARLTTEWLGTSQSQFGFRATRELGNLLRLIERTRQSVNQFGRWSFNNNQLTVRLTNTASSVANPNNRVEVSETTLIFNVSGTTLEATSFDQDIYGTRAFSLYNRQRR